MDKWPYMVVSWSSEQIQKAVNNDDWQRFRKSLKGLPTTMKLDRLDNYYIGTLQKSLVGEEGRDVCIRVDNYINALRRGGQLNMDNEVVKYK